MSGIKLTHPLVLLAGVAVLVGAFVVWRELGGSTPTPADVAAPQPGTLASPPRPPTASAAELATLAAIERRWNDTLQVASRTSRISLAPVVTDLQAQRREAEGVDLGACLGRLQPVLVKRMGREIDDYLDFMAGDGGSFTEKVEVRQRAEARHLEATVERGAMAAIVETCDPGSAAL